LSSQADATSMRFISARRSLHPSLGKAKPFFSQVEANSSNGSSSQSKASLTSPNKMKCSRRGSMGRPRFLKWLSSSATELASNFASSSATLSACPGPVSEAKAKPNAPGSWLNFAFEADSSAAASNEASNLRGPGLNDKAAGASSLTMPASVLRMPSISLFPASAARSQALSPRLFRCMGLALESSSKRQSSMSPLQAASISAVSPKRRSAQARSALALRSMRTVSSLTEDRTAVTRGDSPKTLTAFTGAPAATRSCTILPSLSCRTDATSPSAVDSADPCNHRCRRVLPSTSMAATRFNKNALPLACAFWMPLRTTSKSHRSAASRSGSMST